jgi:hypothetical protein
MTFRQRVEAAQSQHTGQLVLPDHDGCEGETTGADALIDGEAALRRRGDDADNVTGRRPLSRCWRMTNPRPSGWRKAWRARVAKAPPTRPARRSERLRSLPSPQRVLEANG